MRIRIFHICLFFSLFHLKAQKQNVQFNPDGSSTYTYYTKKDTFLLSTYPKGNRESRRSLKRNRVNGDYLRWYENGTLMWRKQMKDDAEHGKAEFFDRSGKKVAVLNYCKGKLCDTVFIAPGRHLLLGRIFSNSRVIGGAQREDGQANVSEYSGPYPNCRMYAVLHPADSTKGLKHLANFRSDMYGAFMLLLPEGRIGFYPQDLPLKDLKHGQFRVEERFWSSGNESWSMKEALEVERKDKILELELRHFTEGYAP